MMKKLYRNMRIFTPVDGGKPLAGAGQSNVAEIKGGAMLVADGLIEKIGPEGEVTRGLDRSQLCFEKEFGGACVIPGFVDPHTHLCFAKRREDEFGMRLAGLPYLEILKRGGGILSSVNAVKSASEEQLFETTKKLALSALAKGTTTIEIKSGYGLNLDLELKMLEVIRRVGFETPLDVIPTFMGAHAVPQEWKNDADRFVDEILIGEMLPKVKAQGIAEFCDVFCEEGVFSIDQSRRLLIAAKEMGFDTKIHADEVHDLGGAGQGRFYRRAAAGDGLQPQKALCEGPRDGGLGRAGGDGYRLQPRLLLLRIRPLHLWPRRDEHGSHSRRGPHRDDAQRRLRDQPREKARQPRGRKTGGLRRPRRRDADDTRLPRRFDLRRRGLQARGKGRLNISKSL